MPTSGVEIMGRNHPCGSANLQSPPKEKIKNNNNHTFAQGPSHGNATTQPNREWETIPRNLHGITCNFLPKLGSCLFYQPTPLLPSLFALLDFPLSLAVSLTVGSVDYPNYRFSPNPVRINFHSPFYVSQNLTHTHTHTYTAIDWLVDSIKFS